MGLTSELAKWWPVVLVIAILGGVLRAFAQCAVSELAARLAAHLYSPDPDVRAAKIEEWTRVQQDMKPGERISHAGALLWVGVKRAPRTAAENIRTRRALQANELGDAVQLSRDAVHLLVIERSASTEGRWLRGLSGAPVEPFTEAPAINNTSPKA